MKKKGAEETHEEVIPEAEGIGVEELLTPETSSLAGWEHGPAAPVIGYEADAQPEAFAQGAELAKIAIELARFHQSANPAECIDQAKALVFQCIKAVCDSSSEREARYQRNQQRLREHIEKRCEPKRIPEVRLWDVRKGVLPLRDGETIVEFHPYFSERKWNDRLKAYIEEVTEEVLAEQVRGGLSFKDWLCRELRSGRPLPDCMKQHRWRCRLEVAEEVWERLLPKAQEFGPPWGGDVERLWLAQFEREWLTAFQADWYSEWKEEIRGQGIRVVDLLAIAKRRLNAIHTRGNRGQARKKCEEGDAEGEANSEKPTTAGTRKNERGKVKTRVKRRN